MMHEIKHFFSPRYRRLMKIRAERRLRDLRASCIRSLGQMQEIADQEPDPTARLRMKCEIASMRFLLKVKGILP